MANAARSQIASIQVRNRFTVELKATSQLSKSTLLIFTAQYSELKSWCKTRQNINSEVHQHSLWQWPQMQTYDYARAALWDTAIKFSLQSRAMTSPDRLERAILVPEPTILLACGRNRGLWEQPFWHNKENNRILPIRFNSVLIYGACPKWLIPELSIPAAGQKDRRIWGREWERAAWRHFVCACSA